VPLSTVCDAERCSVTRSYLLTHSPGIRSMELNPGRCSRFLICPEVAFPVKSSPTAADFYLIFQGDRQIQRCCDGFSSPSYGRKRLSLRMLSVSGIKTYAQTGSISSGGCQRKAKTNLSLFRRMRQVTPAESGFQGMGYANIIFYF
jgi:hypothetical protein